jgi:ABC-2 type transport system permease protein
VSAFLYLVTRSGRNRLFIGLRRVRSPRYLAALIVGGLYVWSLLIRPANSGGITTFLGQPTEMVITVLLVLTLMGAWVFGSDTTALAFSQAELSLLFPAPLSRRALIGYKLFRAQIAVTINVLVWVFILRRGGTAVPPVMRAIGIWALFSTLNLHRLGAALVRSSWREHGAVAARRNVWSIVVFAAVGAALLAGFVVGRHELANADGAGGFFVALGHVLAKPPASIGLYPFHLLVAPTFAHSMSQWSETIGPALLLAVLHLWWVMRTDTAFEDAAIEASAERARRFEAMRSRRSFTAAPPRSAASSLRLSSVGHPALAIIWKNTLCLRRTMQLRVFVGPAAMAIAVGAAMSGTRADAGQIVAVGALAFLGMLLLFGGRLIRNDLRQDMQHLPLIKSLPLPPGDIVLAEVASSAIPMVIVQLALVAFAFLVTLRSPIDPLGPEVRLALLIAAPFAVVALNAALLTIQNGTAVLFPAWVRLGPTVSTGVEALGQNLLVSMANLLGLTLGLILPLLVAWGSLNLAPQGRGFRLMVVVIIAALVLAAETYAAMRFLGRALARAEPSQSL